MYMHELKIIELIFIRIKINNSSVRNLKEKFIKLQIIKLEVNITIL